MLVSINQCHINLREDIGGKRPVGIKMVGNTRESGRLDLKTTQKCDIGLLGVHFRAIIRHHLFRWWPKFGVICLGSGPKISLCIMYDILFALCLLFSV